MFNLEVKVKRRSWCKYQCQKTHRDEMQHIKCTTVAITSVTEYDFTSKESVWARRPAFHTASQWHRLLYLNCQFPEVPLKCYQYLTKVRFPMAMARVLFCALHSSLCLKYNIECLTKDSGSLSLLQLALGNGVVASDAPDNSTKCTPWYLEL